MPSCFGKSAPLILFIWVDGLGKYVVFRQFLVVYLGGMNMFSVRKTVGAYRIRPEVREESAASLGDAVVWFAWFAHVRAYAIRPYSFWLIAWGGWGGLVCVVRPREGVCDTPLHFLADCVGWLVWLVCVVRPREGVCDTPLQFLDDYVGWSGFNFRAPG